MPSSLELAFQRNSIALSYTIKKARSSRSGPQREDYEPFWHTLKLSPRNVNSLLTEVLGGAPK
jgi:hypothetical protein